MSSAPHLWAGFQDTVERLAAHGVPRPSKRWMKEVKRFYLHPTARRWVACCGRGAGKNHVAIMCGITELLHGRFVVAPGEQHFFVEVSENKDEAQKTLRQWSAYLRFVGVDNTPTTDAIELHGDLAHFGIKVQACRVGAVSGFRSPGDTHQELSKWSNGKPDGANPAEEVVTSAAAQRITHPESRSRCFSTPMGKIGFFHELCELGDNEDQVFTQGPSWEFNPTITIESTRAACRDEKKWRREYLAQAQSVASAAFDDGAVDGAFRTVPPEFAIAHEPFGVCDASSGRKDAWTWAVARWVEATDGRRLLHFGYVDGIAGGFWQQMDAETIVERITREMKQRGAETLFADQREDMMLSSAFSRHKMRKFLPIAWTAPRKERAVALVRRWLADKILVIDPGHDTMRKELKNFEERITAAGNITFRAGHAGHDDYASLLLTCAMADLEPRSVGVGGNPGLSGSPNHKASLAQVLVRQAQAALTPRVPRPPPTTPDDYREIYEEHAERRRANEGPGFAQSLSPREQTLFRSLVNNTRK